MQWLSIMTCKHFYFYVHNNNLLQWNPFIFNIWNVCGLLRVPVCVISRVYVHCAHAYRRILLMHSLNKILSLILECILLSACFSSVSTGCAFHFGTDWSWWPKTSTNNAFVHSKTEVHELKNPKKVQNIVILGGKHMIQSSVMQVFSRKRKAGTKSLSKSLKTFLADQ